MNTSHVGTSGTTSKRGQSEKGQPWWKVVRGAEMPGERGYGIQQYEGPGSNGTVMERVP
jgi:hypothetical protein